MNLFEEVQLLCPGHLFLLEMQVSVGGAVYDSLVMHSVRKLIVPLGLRQFSRIYLCLPSVLSRLLSLSSITMPEPLSAFFITISGSAASFLRA